MTGPEEQIKCEGCGRLAWIPWPACRVVRRCGPCNRVVAAVEAGDQAAAEHVRRTRGLWGLLARLRPWLTRGR